MSQQYTPLLSPKGQGPVGPRVGSDLCLQTQFPRLQDGSFLASGVCPLVGEAGLESCARLPGRRGWCLPTGVWSWILALWWAGPCLGVCVEGLWAQEVLGHLPADGWHCVPALLVVWPEVSQHWSSQDVGWDQVWC